ncbi:GIY-YIG nuclease family protein [Arcicella rosea]|uniref:Excinuclease UvrABC nuclease subunit n=1 Tax=Arcicella rosea TaxID=502909 RepID=A0A841EX57_9BACT|nr:hypothetical protein [Arcicella rosea]MBB6004900.1 excinuclease UvrABC nuclease subunit [Arcicella rosea]
MTPQEIKIYLQELEKKLLSDNNRKSIKLTRDWTKQFPTDAGVYLIRESGEISYVGETGSIRARMADLLNTQNHVIRRTIGHTKYKDHISFEKATSQKKFIPEIEIKLNNWIESQLEVSILTVELGRKELEEFLYDKHKPKYNNKGKRTSK